MSEAPENKKMGTGMYWAAALIGLALLTQFFSSLLQRDAEVNGITEKLRQSEDGHYYARGEINGTEVILIVDTGATNVSIPAETAARIRLRKLEESQVSTANGSANVFATDDVRIQLGDIIIDGIKAHINPNMDPPGVLLGMSFLRQLEFRQRDNVLVLKSLPGG